MYIRFGNQQFETFYVLEMLEYIKNQNQTDAI